MKKLMLLAVVALFSFSAVAQGGFRLGANGGIPLGDADMGFSFTWSVDGDYDWEVSDGADVGINTSYVSFLGKDGADSFDYLGAYGSGDVDISDDLSAGADVGYAFNLSGGGEGNFSYRIQVRYQVSEPVDINARWNSLVFSGGSFDHFSLGIGYRFGNNGGGDE